MPDIIDLSDADFFVVLSEGQQCSRIQIDLMSIIARDENVSPIRGTLLHASRFFLSYPRDNSDLVRR